MKKIILDCCIEKIEYMSKNTPNPIKQEILQSLLILQFKINDFPKEKYFHHHSNLMNKSKATLIKGNYILYKKNVIFLENEENFPQFHVGDQAY